MYIEFLQRRFFKNIFLEDGVENGIIILSLILGGKVVRNGDGWNWLRIVQ
jgi:hypothetical protein